MKVGPLLHPDSRERTTIEVTATVNDAAVRMRMPHMRALLVTDGDRPVGMITRRDFFERVISRALPDDTAISEVMSTDLVTATTDVMVEDAVALMKQHSIRHLAVVASDGRPVGVLGLEMLAAWLAADHSARVDDLLFYITHG